MYRGFDDGWTRAIELVLTPVVVAPVLLLGAALGWGVHGALSAGYAMVLVLANFAFSAAILTWTARTSLAAMMAGVLFGYLLRLALITVAVLAVIHQSWVV